MNDIEGAVTRHYGDGGLLGRILAGLEAAGLDPENLQPGDLAPVDEFHIRGRAATERIVARMALRPDQQVLDIGCGIGGAARYIAGATGCRVTGIDLTPEFIAAAKDLTARAGMGDKLTFEVASALAMPFDDRAFDAAITLHVAMNIRDRAGLYGEIARVLKPGAVFAIYDVMRKRGGDLTFPVPWAESADTSHLTTPEEMQALLATAGFDVKLVDDQTGLALEFFRQSLAAAAAADGPPPLGIHLFMGASAPVKFRNVLGDIEAGRIAPVLMIARRRG